MTRSAYQYADIFFDSLDKGAHHAAHINVPMWLEIRPSQFDKFKMPLRFYVGGVIGGHSHHRCPGFAATTSGSSSTRSG